MTRARAWLVSYGLLTLICLGLMTHVSTSKSLLTDTDTQWTITEINLRHDPWRWFHHDWPIGNHFFRPVSTELFELDNRLHPNSDYGWGLTNGILCILATLALFWFLRELTDSPLLTTLSTGLFYLWQTDSAGWLGPFLMAVAVGVLVVGVWRQRHRPLILRFADRALTTLVRRRKAPVAVKIRALGAIIARVVRMHWRTWSLVLPPVLIWCWLAQSEIAGVTPLGFRMLGWIPGRTASSMTACAFLSLAAFARYMRLLKRRPIPATAYDRPNTRSSEPSQERAPSAGWPLLATVGLALALLCYEQAVVVPALLGLVGLAWYFRGAAGRWWLWGIPFGVVLLGYLVARNMIIPPGNSWYYNWQKRTTGTAIDSLNRYFLFFLSHRSERRELLFALWTPLLWITARPWVIATNIVAAGTAFYQMRRRWVLAGFAWVASSVAYAPMAWFKDFDHYHYFPMALRALFDAVMIWIALELTVIAVSPRARQAPPRLSPAPGSLPRQ